MTPSGAAGDVASLTVVEPHVGTKPLALLYVLYVGTG